MNSPERNVFLPESVLTIVFLKFAVLRFYRAWKTLYEYQCSQTRMDEALHGLELHTYGLCRALLVINT